MERINYETLTGMRYVPVNGHSDDQAMKLDIGIADDIKFNQLRVILILFVLNEI
ncbi:MAG: hypothetical protein AB2L20_00210 [Mangrovibacterium sp.]